MNSAARSLLFVTVLLFSVSLCAQRRDYIVNLQKDTLYGTLRFSFGQPFELIADTDIYSVSEKLIDAYFVAEKRMLYKSRKLPGKRNYSFLCCIESGRINLYRSTIYIGQAYSPDLRAPTASQENTTLYAEKIEGTLVEIKNTSMWKSGKKQKEAFLELIADNPNIVELYNQNKEFSVADLQYYIHEYNKHPVPQ
jgi:hypothetical protein